MALTRYLLPNTGIQHINLGTIEIRGQWPSYTISNQINNALQLDATSVHDAGRPRFTHPKGGSQTATICKSELNKIEEFCRVDGGWLPIPMNSSGCQSAMLWLERIKNEDDSKDQFHAVLAIDTTISLGSESGPLKITSVPSQLMLDGKPEGEFWQELGPYIDRHIESRQRSNPEDTLWQGAVQAHLAGFYSVLAESECIPVVEIANPQQQPVDITLVVDLGNSRTCCVLREMDTLEGRPLFHPLRLVNPKKPLDATTEPFDSRMVFVVPWSGVYGGSSTFQDLSMVRMGKFASDILGGMSTDVGTRGMSGPKRYLWDDVKRTSPWQFADGSEATAGGAIQGSLLVAMDPQYPFKPSSQAIPDPANPCYPRKAGLIFAMVEILEQAFRQANSEDFRGARVQQDGYLRRRVMRNVVIMTPAGMHSEEIKLYEEGVRRAADIWAQYRTDQTAFRQGEAVDVMGLERNSSPESRWMVTSIPHVVRACDEGLSIQLCYLYGMLEHRFQRQTNRMVSLLGRQRDGRPSLRIASLDIGGGTTDLAIADYYPELQNGRHVPQFELKRLFHEGIARGGDDLCLELLEARILPQIAKSLPLTADQWNRAFSANRGDNSPQWAMERRRLVPLFWAPLLRGCLSRLERNEKIDPKSKLKSLLSDVAQGRIDALNRQLEALAGKSTAKLDVLKADLSIEPADLLVIMRNALGAVFDQFCDVLGQFTPDILIVGGRPASLPQVRQLLEERLPVAPGQMVFLHEQQLGDWFPFALEGRIGDSKTCSVIGAALMYTARYAGQDSNVQLVLRGDDRQTAAGCNVLGILNGRLLALNESLLFQDDQVISDRIPFHGTALLVGCRRIDGRNAISKPAYRIELQPEISRYLRSHPIENAIDCVLRLRRSDVGSDRIDHIENMQGEVRFYDGAKERKLVNRADVVKLRLQTMLENEYWLDSGHFGELRESAEEGGAA